MSSAGFLRETPQNTQPVLSLQSSSGNAITLVICFITSLLWRERALYTPLLRCTAWKDSTQLSDVSFEKLFSP